MIPSSSLVVYDNYIMSVMGNICVRQKIVVYQVLSVRRVGRRSFYLRDKALVKEDLANMRDVVSDVSTVVEERAVGLVSHDVDVVSTTRVVSREDCQPLGDTIFVSLLNATEEGRIDIFA